MRESLIRDAREVLQDRVSWYVWHCLLTVEEDSGVTWEVVDEKRQVVRVTDDLSGALLAEVYVHERAADVSDEFLYDMQEFVPGFDWY